MQYLQGKTNSIAYRRARRSAHNAQTELSSMISSLSTEPDPDQNLIQYAFRYLVYSHSQLSYISALGSHREQVQDAQVLDLLQWCQQTLDDVLLQQKPLDTARIQQKLFEIQTLNAEEILSNHLQLVLKQISLLLETLPELIQLRTQLIRAEIK